MALLAIFSLGALMAFAGGSDDVAAETDTDPEDLGTGGESGGETGGESGAEAPLDLWIRGTAGPNEITGTAGDDLIDAGAGDDTVDGGAGNDLIYLGAGDDIANGGAGNDTIFGEAGDDLIIDQSGADWLYGGDGSDIIVAEDLPGQPFAPDRLYGGDGDDLLFGDDGDTMTGGAGVDMFTAWFDEADDEAVTITDFDWATEQLFLDFDEGVFGSLDDSDLTHEVNDGAFLVRLFVAGKEAAILTNTTAFDASRVSVSSFA